MKKFFEDVCENIIIFIMIVYSILFFTVCKLIGINLDDDF